MNKIHPHKLIASAVKTLPARMKEVIEKRYGLKTGIKRTLESVGKDYRITRERVRQIEEAAFKHLKKPDNLNKLKLVFNILDDHLKLHGDLRKEDKIFKEIRDDLDFSSKVNLKPSLMLVLYFFSQNFFKHSDTQHLHSFWTRNKTSVKKAIQFINNVILRLDKIKKPLAEKDFYKLVNDEAGILHPKAVSSYLDIDKRIYKNSFGEMGLSSWPEINPRGVKDKAFIVLKKEAKPIHFREIARLINEFNFDSKIAHAQTVHNELIRDERFVLVGRGTYGLKEWGFIPGTVKDVIVNILKESRSPVSQEKIIKMVSDQRIVKNNTVFINLQNRELFKKTDGGYTLV